MGNAAQVVEWRRRQKARLLEHFGAACVRCGYDKCHAALVFHHRDPDTKEFSIGGCTRAFKRLLHEAEKCDLLCANCHAEEHYDVA